MQHSIEFSIEICFALRGAAVVGGVISANYGGTKISRPFFFLFIFNSFFFCVLITFERSRKHGQWSNDRALQLAVCEFYTAISGEIHVVVESVCVEWSLFWVFI